MQIVIKPPQTAMLSKTPLQIQYVKIQNFRALRKVELKNLTSLTILLDPNGSGKSTLFDVFAFLSECFEIGLRRAWDKHRLKTRSIKEAVVIEIQYKETDYPTITYHLAVDERNGAPFVKEEWLKWRRGKHGQPFNFLNYKEGSGKVISGELPDEKDKRIEIPLKSPDLLAVNALGQLAEYPRIAALRDFITGWHISYLTISSLHLE